MSLTCNECIELGINCIFRDGYTVPFAAGVEVPKLRVLGSLEECVVKKDHGYFHVQEILRQAAKNAPMTVDELMTRSFGLKA